MAETLLGGTRLEFLFGSKQQHLRLRLQNRHTTHPCTMAFNAYSCSIAAGLHVDASYYSQFSSEPKL